MRIIKAWINSGTILVGMLLFGVGIFAPATFGLIFLAVGLGVVSIGVAILIRALMAESNSDRH
jgi:hypothetical protein